MLTTQYYELKLIIMWAYDTVINNSEVEYKRQTKLEERNMKYRNKKNTKRRMRHPLELKRRNGKGE